MSSAENKIIWVIGNKNSHADRSFDWNIDEVPNLLEPDVIIIDLTTLSAEKLKDNLEMVDDSY